MGRQPVGDADGVFLLKERAQKGQRDLFLAGGTLGHFEEGVEQADPAVRVKISRHALVDAAEDLFEGVPLKGLAVSFICEGLYSVSQVGVRSEESHSPLNLRDRDRAGGVLEDEGCQRWNGPHEVVRGPVGGRPERLGPLVLRHLRVVLGGLKEGADGLLDLGVVVVHPVGACPAQAIRLLLAVVAHIVVEIVAHRARHRVRVPIGRRVGLVGGKGLKQALVKRLGE